MPEVTGILLAAGYSKRFGDAKLLQRLPGGIPVCIAAAQAMQEHLPNTLAVIRKDDDLLKTAFEEIGLKAIENPYADEGMGTSLASGINATTESTAWLIALADMPWINPATIGLLADHLRHGASIVAPTYQGQRGHPVGFASHWRNSLGTLSGDKGAKRLIKDHTRELILVDTQDLGILKDIDFPKDLESFSSQT